LRCDHASDGSGLDIARVEVDPKTSKIVVVMKGEPEEKIWRKTAATGATLHLGRRITAIDPRGRSVTDDRRTKYRFTKLLLATGGAPRQLTYYPARGPLAPRWGYDNQVYGWTNDGKRVLFRSGREAYSRFTRLYTIGLNGGEP